MKLTKAQREEFVDAVMADVPSVDHDEIIRAFLVKEALSLLPAPVRKMWNGPHASYIHTSTVTVSGYNGEGKDKTWHSASAVVPLNQIEGEYMKLVTSAQPAFQAWMDDVDARRALEHQLRYTVSGCATREQLLAALPDFEKYLPEPTEAPSRMVPALATSLIEQLTSAGFPA